MEWHIMTSSKGGIGKTLLALLLLAHFLEKESQARTSEEGAKPGSTLVLDLNGVNADSSAILLYKKKVGGEVIIALNEKLVPVPEAEQIIIHKTYSYDNNGKQCFYAVGWPLNPFGLYNPRLFAELLSEIKGSAKEIAAQHGLPPLQRVIIDTNCHFCNIFSKKEEDYTLYTKGKLKDDSINIWFLWVYRQLSKLIEKKENEYIVVEQTAKAIEKNLSSHVCKNGGVNLTPFIHVFNPIVLASSQANEHKNKGVWASIIDAIIQNKDYTIKPLKEVEQLHSGACITFEALVEKLGAALVRVGPRPDDDPHLLFLDMLIEAINNQFTDSSSGEYPMNVVPLSVYESTLQGYTDKERYDAVAKLRTLAIYNNFSKILCCGKK
jgi:hypothetical protein